MNFRCVSFVIIAGYYSTSLFAMTLDEAQAHARTFGELPAERYVTEHIPDGATIQRYKVLEVNDRKYLQVRWTIYQPGEEFSESEDEFILDDFGSLVTMDYISEQNRVGKVDLIALDCDRHTTFCLGADLAKKKVEYQHTNTLIETWIYLSASEVSEGNVTFSGKGPTVGKVANFVEKNRVNGWNKEIENTYAVLRPFDFLIKGRNGDNINRARRANRQAFKANITATEINQLQEAALVTGTIKLWRGALELKSHQAYIERRDRLCCF